MTLKQSIHSVARKVLPDRQMFRLLEKTTARPDDVGSHALLLKRFRPTNPNLRFIYLNQRISEWRRFTDFLRARGFPRRILEIGTGLAGSAYSFSRLAPKGSLIVTVDMSPLAREYVAIYERPGRARIVNVIGDSHAPSTIESVGRALGGEPVDLLYIDGDHSYEGVKKDFEDYTKFCRGGAVVAFHDIHPDVLSANGKPTESASGDVYRFWGELKSRYPDHQEFIEAPGQDGFGIGVIEYPAS